jgi:hypothetical protein
VGAPAPGVARTSVLGHEAGESFLSSKVQVLAHGAGDRSVHLHPLGLKLHQCTHPNSTHDYGVHLPVSQCFHGLTHAVSVMLVSVSDLFDVRRIRIDNDEPWR